LSHRICAIPGIVTTAGLLPFEVYEVHREVTIRWCLLFAANIAAMVCLSWRRYRPTSQRNGAS
jgi:uncharacterized membrane protein (DUF2068 family)